jgi:hypothetical protein
MHCTKPSLTSKQPKVKLLNYAHAYESSKLLHNLVQRLYISTNLTTY